MELNRIRAIREHHKKPPSVQNIRIMQLVLLNHQIWGPRINVYIINLTTASRVRILNMQRIFDSRSRRSPCNIIIVCNDGNDVKWNFRILRGRECGREKLLKICNTNVWGEEEKIFTCPHGWLHIYRSIELPLSNEPHCIRKSCGKIFSHIQT